MDYNIFYSHCLIREKEYEFCIDHSEEQNVVSSAMVKELNLPTGRNDYPHYFVEGNNKFWVTRQAWIPLTVGGHRSNLLCDVVPLTNDHLILARPWLQLYKVRYNSSRTRYSFYDYGKQYVLESRPSTQELQQEIMVDIQALLDTLRKADEEMHKCEVEFRLKNERRRQKGLVEMEKEEKTEDVVSTRAEELEREEENSSTVVNAKVEVDEPEIGEEQIEMSEVSIVEEERKELIVVEAQVDTMLLNSCSSCVVSSVQVHENHPCEEKAGLLDQSNAAPILPLGSRDLVHIDGKPEHVFIDPFVAHGAAHHSLNGYDYVAPFSGFIVDIPPRVCSFVPVVKFGSSCQWSIGLQSCINFVFDPGISLRLFVVCSSFVCVDELYDILLIRGRILSNREGMM